MTRAILLWAVCVAASACATGPRDPFGAAEYAMKRHDLAGALQSFDTVPVGHTRYPEARAAAMEVERTMRRCHELVLEAMLLRAEWRDREALATLQRAHTMWPTLTSVDVLIVATQQRLLLLGDLPSAASGTSGTNGTNAAPVAAPMGESAPAVRPAPPMPAAAPTAEPTGAPDTSAARAAQPDASGDSSEPQPSAVDDPVALGLVTVESKLGAGQLESAVRDLVDLAGRFPRDPRVRVRLARLLHQRALVRYGEGALSAAIADWRRVLDIDPAHEAAKRLLELAEQEEQAGQR